MLFNNRFVNSLLAVCFIVMLAGASNAQTVKTGDFKTEGGTPGIITSVPRTMTYQGILKDNEGNPYNGILTVEFKIYNVESGGSSLWYESQDIEFVDGYFTVELGTINLLNLSFDEDYWLELIIGSDILSPRQKVTMSAYSARTDTSDYASNSDLLDGMDSGDFALVDHNHDDEYVNENQPNSITSDMIIDETIQFGDIGQNGADINQVMKWNGSEWIAANDETGGIGWNWSDSSSHGPDSVLFADTSTYADTSDYANTASIANFADSTDAITDGAVYFADIGQNAATVDQVMKWNGSEWIAANDETGGIGWNWSDSSSHGPDSVLFADTSTYADTSDYANTASIANFADSTDAITDGAVYFADIGQNAATVNQVMKWNGSAWVASDDEVGAGGEGWADDGTVVRLETIDDSVGIGTTTPTEKLDVSGNIKASGTITSGSSITIDGVNNEITSTIGTIDFDDEDIVTTGKATIGLNHTNTGTDAFVAGSNNTTSGAQSTIGGGYLNTASQQATTVGGGQQNEASGSYSTIAGGLTNIASGYISTVSGGKYCKARGQYSVVGGGGGLTEADSNSAIGDYSTIGGGKENIASAYYATIAGGAGNTAISNNSTVGGGGYNNATDYAATVGGGNYNNANGYASTVGGGRSNYANGRSSTVAGGEQSTANGDYATVNGGFRNYAIGNYALAGGGSHNYARGQYSVICGGGGSSAADSNSASGMLSFIGGGSRNSATNTASAICGGAYNSASGFESTVGGGFADTAKGDYGGVFSGKYNLAGDEALDTAAFVGGGYSNSATADYSTIGGGGQNTASNKYSTVSGGYQNSAFGLRSTIGGGYHNTTNNSNSTVGGGHNNTASEGSSTVGGGTINTASGVYSTVSGGWYNTASGWASTIGGGGYNDCEGEYSVIPGGVADTLTSYADYSMAFGKEVYLNNSYRVAFFEATNHGRLGLNRDDHDGGISHPIHVGTNVNNGNGARLTAGGIWTSTSSRSFKENFQPLDGRQLLSKISSMQVDSWNFKGSDEKHVGPIAEDFVAAFDVGTIRDDGTREDMYLAAGDVAGVALAGVKELVNIIEELKQQNIELQHRIAELERSIK